MADDAGDPRTGKKLRPNIKRMFFQSNFLVYGLTKCHFHLGMTNRVLRYPNLVKNADLFFAAADFPHPSLGS